MLLISACTDGPDSFSSLSDSDKTNYQEIEWEELDPNDPQQVDYSATVNHDSFDLSNEEFIEEGYVEEEFIGADEYSDGEEYIDEYSELPSLSELTSGNIGISAQTQAQSFGIVPEMDGKNIRLPGFIVPVEFEGTNLVTEFFLVPYFGACIHQPPPPPNQTVYVTSEKPIKFTGIYDPVWVMGTIKTERTGNYIATAEYKIDLNRIAPYTE